MSKNTKYYQKKGLEFLANVVRETNDLYLVHCGHQICSPHYTYQHKTKKDYHLHFILGGKGSFQMGKQAYTLSKDDIFVLLPDTDFSYQADGEEPWEYFWLAFNGDIAAKNLGYIGLGYNNPTIHSNLPVKNYLPYITRLLSYHELNRANSLFRVAIMYEMLADLMTAQNQKPTKSYHYPKESYFKYAKNYINAKYAEITVRDVAAYIGITSQYLANIFKEMSDVSPKQYIINRRMKEAEKLITSSDLQIQEIALQVGYQDPLTFSKVYKSHFGKSPLNHRLSTQGWGGWDLLDSW